MQIDQRSRWAVWHQGDHEAGIRALCQVLTRSWCAYVGVFHDRSMNRMQRRRFEREGGFATSNTMGLLNLRVGDVIRNGPVELCWFNGASITQVLRAVYDRTDTEGIVIVCDDIEGTPLPSFISSEFEESRMLGWAMTNDVDVVRLVFWDPLAQGWEIVCSADAMNCLLRYPDFSLDE